METGKSIQQHLQHFLLTDGFTAEEIQQVSALSEFTEHPKGTAILREGSRNEKLHLLVSGSVNVLKAGEKISTLGTPGSVLGEISLITGKECVATIVAETPVSLLTVDLSKVGSLSERLQERFLSATHRLFSLILAEKLAATNEKARLFEITNRELKKAEKALESASATKISELASNQQGLLGKGESLLQKDLAPLVKLADKASDPKAARQLAAAVKSLASKAQLITQAGPSKLLSDVKVIIAEDDVQEQIYARMSLGGTGAQCTVVSDLESGEKALKDGPCDILCVNNRLLDLIPIARKIHPKIRCVFVTSDEISVHLQTLRERSELSTIVARHPEDRAFTVRNMATTIAKLATGDLFGIQKYLSWGTEVHEYPVTGSEQRHELMDHLKTYLDGIGAARFLARRSMVAAEELLMNAVYDAPHTPEGKPLYNHLQRTVPIQLAPSEQSVFRFACDGSLVAVSVEDPFGALTRSIVLNYLERCFRQQIAVDIEGKGGGGNGLFQMLQSSSLVVFNVQPGKRTEVIALASTSIQFEKVKPHPSFHFFEA